MNTKLVVSAASSLLVLSSAAVAGPWQHPWRNNHPWRAEDNARLRNQNARITQGVRDGQLSHAQATALRSDDHAIRAEERADASVNGSHLTYGEERNVWQQENANSRAIYAGRH